MKAESLLVFSIFGIHLTPLFAGNQNFPQPDLVSPRVVMASLKNKYTNKQTNLSSSTRVKEGQLAVYTELKNDLGGQSNCIFRGLSTNPRLLFYTLPSKSPVFRDYLMSPIPESFAVPQIGLLQGFYNIS